MEVDNLIVIPKHFFANDVIEKRKPLRSSARRAGWVGCSILLKNIPEYGKIFFIKDSIIQNKKSVLLKWSKTTFLQEQKKENRGWLIEIMKLLDRIPKKSFTLKEIYTFEEELHRKYPQNHFIKDKIRQQLQVLRDKGLLEFRGRGFYSKV